MLLCKCRGRRALHAIPVFCRLMHHKLYCIVLVHTHYRGGVAVQSQQQALLTCRRPRICTLNFLITSPHLQPHLPQVRCKLASTNTLALHLRQACKLHLHSTCRKYAHLISTCGSKKGVHCLPTCQCLHCACLVWTRACQSLKLLPVQVAPKTHVV